MDPITHGITGALLGKGYFSDRYGRASVLAVTLGSIFPDVDIAAEPFAGRLAILKYHRGFTHSFLGLPLFAATLAAIHVWHARRRGRECPSWTVLAAAYAVGIASHIVLDAMTSFGTRIFNPLSRDRVAWDLLFIIDFTFTAIVLLPQVLAWVYRDRDKGAARRGEMWLLFSAGAAGVWYAARAAMFPFSTVTLGILVALLGAIFYLPAGGWWGFGVRRSSWCRAGVYVMLGYFAACGAAHHLALDRVRAFAAQNHLDAESIGALPLPPSLLDWNGLILVRDGVYQAPLDLRQHDLPNFRFFADAASNPYIEKADALPSVGLVLWFARFPVVHYRTEDGRHIVEYFDLRFYGRRPGRPLSFTYRVEFGTSGAVLDQGWELR